MKFKNTNFTRDVSLQLEQSQNKQLVFSICSEEPYLREDETFGPYYQVLEVTPEAINDERLKSGISFLKDHDSKSQLGIVKRWWIANKKLYVSVKFSRSNFAKSIKEDIEEGVRPWCSIGYYVEKFEKTGTAEDGIPILTAKRYSIYEASSVSIPADFTCGFNRELEIKQIQQKGQDMNAQTNKTDSTSELAEQKLERQETDLGLENKDLAGKDLETKSEEATEGEEETGKEEKELCPECNKPIDECECKQKAEETEDEEKPEEKACGGAMKPQEKSLEPTKEALAEALKKQQEADATEIRSLGELAGEQKSAEEFISQKRSLDQFKTYLKTKNADNSKNSIQKDKKMNKQYFSISKAIRNACSQYKVDVSEEYETKVNADNKRDLNINDADIVLSNKEIRQRGVLTGGLSEYPNYNAGTNYTNEVGQSLIATDYLPQEYVTYLRPQLTLEKTGYYSIPVNGNSVSFAVCTSGSVAKMYNLDGELEDGDLKFSTKTLVPHKAGVCVPVNYSMILQARPEVDALVENDVVNALYQLRDEQILIGQGTVPSANLFECQGILNTAGINEVSGAVSGGWTWKLMLQAENEIRKKNIFSENLAFIMNGDTYVDLCSTPKIAGNFIAGFIIDNDKIKNFPVYVNNSIPSGTILLGDFGEVAVADFEGLKIKVDDITYIKQGAIQIVATKAFDCVVRRPGAFTKITLG